MLASGVELKVFKAESWQATMNSAKKTVDIGDSPKSCLCMVTSWLENDCIRFVFFVPEKGSLKQLPLVSRKVRHEVLCACDMVHQKLSRSTHHGRGA